ncbi:uncharacterized protein ARMOST_11501 [Armillaria ostoyae]|uniref:Uncharacterized protein n=1 Tax=Armillaria ostoyae TaxID=47428 RepID=A0A284RHA7_ARMOS|nr:uncharacterized protein ARMOST_11501 [Armillaria ostoyae]
MVSNNRDVEQRRAPIFLKIFIDIILPDSLKIFVINASMAKTARLAVGSLDMGQVCRFWYILVLLISVPGLLAHQILIPCKLPPAPSFYFFIEEHSIRRRKILGLISLIDRRLTDDVPSS